jgi:hypothetical protein
LRSNAKPLVSVSWSAHNHTNIETKVFDSFQLANKFIRSLTKNLLNSFAV